MKIVHERKTSTVDFIATWNGNKPFKLMEYDEKYRVGDLLKFHEWESGTGYTYRIIWADILSIMRSGAEYGLIDGYCIVGIRPFLVQSEKHGITPVGLDHPALQKFKDILDVIKDQNNPDLTAKVFAAMGINELP